MKKIQNLLIVAFVVAMLTGCDTLGFYQQAAFGQWQLMRARIPIGQVLADPDRSADLKTKLESVQGMLAFAEDHLLLEVDKKYRSYAELNREFVVWNVFAAEPLSVTGVEWCYPLVGCTPYRGYFSESDAYQFAADLEADGRQTYVGGVPAYSTLGWFDDPLLSTFLHWPEPDIAALLFHELAHSRIWLEHDVAFNESFATAVAQAAMSEFYNKRNEMDVYFAWRERGEEWRMMRDRLVALKDRLEANFNSEQTEAEKLAKRDSTYSLFRDQYKSERSDLGNGRFDRLVNETLNNAYLVSIGTYQDWVPAFTCIYQRSLGWEDFYNKIEGLAGLSESARVAELEGCVLTEVSDTSSL